MSCVIRSALSLSLSLSLSDFLYTSLSLSLSPPNTPFFVFSSLCLFVLPMGIPKSLLYMQSYRQVNSTLLFCCLILSVSIYLFAYLLPLPLYPSLVSSFLGAISPSKNHSSICKPIPRRIPLYSFYLRLSLSLSSCLVLFSHSLSLPLSHLSNPHCISFVNEEQQLSQSQALHKVRFSPCVYVIFNTNVKMSNVNIYSVSA